MNIAELRIGDVIDFKTLVSRFGGQRQGGILYTKATNTLVLISDHTKALYDDRWEGPVMHYTGQGRIGDQKFQRNNKTLRDSPINGADLHLFEAFEKEKYFYHGNVKLHADPYYERQTDEEGNDRAVIIFPVIKADGQAPTFSGEQIQQLADAGSKKARKLSDSELEKLVAVAGEKQGSKKVTSERRDRNPLVAELARRRAQGICQLCEQPAPFQNKKKEPYLEVHHIVWLSKGGKDSRENTVALCPNCHRRMHIVDCKKDIAKLQKKAS